MVTQTPSRMTQRCITMAVAALLAALADPGCGRSGEIGEDVQNALLQGDWTKAAEAIEADDALAANPTARLILAHAKLAGNATNDATALFFTVDGGDDARHWLDWSKAFIAAHPNSHVASYLHADALVRNGRLEEAKEFFDKSVAANPHFGLARNARGVWKAVQGDQNGALIELDEATRVQPDLVVAQVNRGFVGYLGRFVPDPDSDGNVYVAGFDDALKLDDECALAYLGRGTILFALGKYDEAARDFTAAYMLCPILAVAQVNHGVTEMYAELQCEVEAAARELAATLKPGATVDTRSIMQATKRRIEQTRQNLERSLPAGRSQAFAQTDFSRATPQHIQGMVREFGPARVLTAAHIQKVEIARRSFERRQATLSSHPGLARQNSALLGRTVARDTIRSMSQTRPDPIRDLFSGLERQRASVYDVASRHRVPSASEAATRGLLDSYRGMAESQAVAGLGNIALATGFESIRHLKPGSIAQKFGFDSMKIKSGAVGPLLAAGRTALDFSRLYRGGEIGYQTARRRAPSAALAIDILQTLNRGPHRPESSRKSVFQIHRQNQLSSYSARGWARYTERRNIKTFEDQFGYRPGSTGRSWTKETHIRSAIERQHRGYARDALTRSSIDRNLHRAFEPSLRPNPTHLQRDLKAILGPTIGPRQMERLQRPLQISPTWRPLDSPTRVATGPTGVRDMLTQFDHQRALTRPPTVPVLRGPGPGGIALSMAHAHRDCGAWPVIAFSTLLYEAFLPDADEAEGEESEEGESTSGAEDRS